jgi:hypothetical protein
MILGVGMVWAAISLGQCASCEPDPGCTSADGFPTICPELLPDGLAGEPYEAVITFYLPVSVVDPGSGLTATLNSVAVTGIQGLPQGMEVTLSEADGVYEPPAGQTEGCGTLCGTPIWPGDYVITIQISAQASAFGIVQEVNESFSYDLHIEGGGAATFTADTTSGCGGLVAAFASSVTADAPQQISWEWQFEGAASESVFGDGTAAAVWDEPGAYQVSVTTTVSDLVLNALNVTSGATSGGLDDFFTPPDLYFTVSSSSGVVYTSGVVADAATPSWSSLSVPLTNPPYTIAFWDEDNALFGDDAMGSFTWNPTGPGPTSFNASPTIGNLNVGLVTAFELEDSMAVYVLPVPDPGEPEATEAGLVVPGDSLGWEVTWWAGDSLVGAGSPWWPPANGPYEGIVVNGEGCEAGTDSVLWCAPNATLELEVVDSLLVPEPGFVDYVLIGPEAWVDLTGAPWTAPESGWYVVEAEDGWGCVANSAPTLVCLDWGVPELTEGDEGVLVATFGLVNYAWWLEGQIITGATDSTFLPTIPGSYLVEASDHPDCPLQESLPWVVVTLEEGNGQMHRVGPNPFRHALWVHGPDDAAAWEVEVFDLSGRCIEIGKGGAGTGRISLLETRPSGTYLVSINKGPRLLVVKQDG